MVDGWELNGEFFPSPEDHHLPLEQRIKSECGSHQTSSRYLSSQNAALIQYRVPRLGQGFSLRVNYVKNPQRNSILFLLVYLYYLVRLNQQPHPTCEYFYDLITFFLKKMNSVQYPGGRNVIRLHFEQSWTSSQLQCHYSFPGQHFVSFTRCWFHRAKTIESIVITSSSFDYSSFSSDW